MAATDDGSDPEPGAWLVRDGVVLASLEVADGPRSRARGLLGRTGIDGALLLRGCRSVHTVGMRFDIDVAFCDDELVVVKVLTVPRHRLTMPVWSARHVIEAEAGVMVGSWGLRCGDRLEIR